MHVVHFDGGVSMQRGVAAGAAILYTADGEELARRSKFMRSTSFAVMTNNIAEYTALVVGLQLALELGVRRVKAMGDSELVVRQVNGVYRVRDPTLVVYHHQVKSLYPLFEDVEVEVFPKAGPRKKRRYGNAAADALATETMNEGRDIYARSRQTA